MKASVPRWDVDEGPATKEDMGVVEEAWGGVCAGSGCMVWGATCGDSLREVVDPGWQILLRIASASL